MSRSTPNEPPAVSLDFTIAGSSEPSGIYVAENILVDNPLDQNSRWSSAYPSTVKQWVLLRLKELSIIKSITFGKIHSAHPCNMKDFKVLVGTAEENMVEVLHAGLRNDSIPETFKIKHCNRAGIYFPSRYVKIIPLSAHAPGFHMSIWFVSLSGISDEQFVEDVRATREEYREVVVLRQILKHLRQRRFLTPYHDILSRTGLGLEHPLVTKLHDSLVLQGNWSRVEELLRSASDAGLFVEYIYACQARALWSQLKSLDLDGDKPSRRGGHAMCIDERRGLIYLFGGWDGQKSLDDFWVYDTARDTWRMLSMSTSREKNGPTPRACHKMVLDTSSGFIYLLGCLGEGDEVATSDTPAGPGGGDDDASMAPPDARNASPRRSTHAASAIHTENYNGYRSDFYRYRPQTGKWELLQSDTATMGGPPLIFDHQMAIDSEAQVIYVSGGRVADIDGETSKHAGLYAYDITANRWKLLNATDVSNPNTSIHCRDGHSMVLDPNSQHLIIFGGQVDQNYTSDMYAFHIPTGTVTELFSNMSASGGPNPCFTQRAVIDCELREIYVFGGLTRAQAATLPVLEAEALNYTYRYTRADCPGKWTRIVNSVEQGTSNGHPTSTMQPKDRVPVSRYAHQMVYHPLTKTAYVHGGNDGLEQDDLSEGADNDGAGEQGLHRADGGARVRGAASSQENRLDDFWTLQLQRPDSDEIIRRAKYEVRQQKFREMCEDGPEVAALAALQTEVASVVNHADPEEAKVFHSLLSYLLARPSRPKSKRLHPMPSDTMPSSGPSPISHSLQKDQSATQSAVLRETERGRDTAAAETTQDASMSDAHDADEVIERVLRIDEDPAEASRSGTASPPSGERYEQRTQVFERLLLFINESAKQPQKDLLDLVDMTEDN